MLSCVECKTHSDERAKGWQAHHAHDPYEDEEPLVVFYCPSCAEREFGDGLHDLPRRR